MGGWSHLKGGIKRKVNVAKGHLKSGSSTYADVALTSLNAIYDSADAFPPLKSAAGGVLALLRTVERVKASRKKAKALSERAVQVFEALEKALPANRATIPPSMIANIKQFQDTVLDIHRALEPLTRQRLPFSRLNRNEGALDALKQRLDDAYQSFTAATVTRIELKTVAVQRELTAIKHQAAIIQRSIQDQEAVTQRLAQVLDLFQSLGDQAAPIQKTMKNSLTYFTIISIGLF